MYNVQLSIRRSQSLARRSQISMKHYVLGIMLMFMIPLNTFATYRGPYYLNDQSTGDVKWYADTGNDKQEKFRLNDSYISGDYWKYYKTNGSTGTVTRQKPYIDFTVGIFRDPKDKFICTKDQKHYTASPQYAEVFVTCDLGYRLKVGELWQREWNENTSFYFKANGAAANAGTITVVGNSNPGRVRVHYYPSSEMLKKCKKFTMVVYRKEHFYDDGIFSDDWDHIYYTYEKEYKIDFKDQLKASVNYYKPGQMLFTVEGQVEEFQQLQDYDTRNFYKNALDQSKTYVVKVENVATKKIVTSEVEYDLKRETTTKVIDLPDYENSRMGYNCYCTLTDKSQVKTSEGHQAGWILKKDETLPLYALLYPKDIKVEFDQFRQQNTIFWYNENWADGMDRKTRYVLYRRLATSADGSPAKSAKWSYVNEVNIKTGNTPLYKIVDNDDVAYRKYYTYRIEAVPSAWEDNNFDMPSAMSETLPSDAYITATTNTDPVMTYNNMEQDVTVTDKIHVSWSYSRIPGTNGNVEFTVYRNKKSDGPDKWEKVASDISAPARPSETKKPYYEDEDVESCELYSYKVYVTSADSTFESEAVQATLLDRSIVKFVETTKGKDETTVNLRWDAKQVGETATHYVVERRYANSRNENDWQQIYSVTGTDDHYTYDDETVEAGRYYSYRISAYVPDCKFEQQAKSRWAASKSVNLDEYAFSNSLSEIGFGLCKGVISGRVTFSTNTGVDNVRIDLKSNDEGLDGQLQNYSKRIDTETTGIQWKDKTKKIQEVINKKQPFTVQLWAMPDGDLADVPLVTLPGMGTITARIEKDQWSHVSIVVNGSEAKVIVNADTLHPTKQTLTLSDVNTDFATVSFGAGAFRGYIKDIRIWEGALTGKDILNNHGRILSGRETGLRLYWPLDEGLQEVAFDISNTNGTNNNRHAVLDPAITNSNVLPSMDQLSLYGITDDKGNYTVRGIPFVANGSSYSVIPSKGIHTFAATSLNVFIGKGSMALNGIDFTDISSFTYTGTVRYLNTTIPVDSVMFKVDGVPVSKDNVPVMSDSEGRYEISVPIGNHYVEAYKLNHVTSRYPEVGTWEFLEEGTLNFSDSTVVNVAGRVNGGIDSQTAPIGFHQTKNRIGQATITLALETERNNQFNMKLDGLNGFVHITDKTDIPSQDDSIKSENWYSTTEPTDILIRTNNDNGEFSAMLPPLRYQVKSIKFEEGSRNNNIQFFNENLPVIDARFKPGQIIDTLKNAAGKIEKYECWGRFVLNYRSEPELTVVQDEMPEGAFGEKVFTDEDDKQEYSFIDVDADGKFIGYKWSKYPMFNQNTTYTFWIKAEEKYYAYNQEAGKEDCFVIPVTDGTVHIANEMSVNTEVTDNTVTYNGETYPANTVLKAATLEVGLDKNGSMGYRWTSGDPNIQDEHLRYLSLSLIANNRSYNWPGPYKTNNLPGIILGSVLTGTNFVTKAPDQVEYVLRDPGGASSFSFWQNDSISATTTRKSHGFYRTSNSDIAVTVKAGAHLVYEAGLETGVGAMGFINAGLIATKINTNVSTEMTPLLVSAGGTGVWDTYHSSTTTFSTRVQTPTDTKHVGRAGDTFIGTAKNLYYGNGIYVYLKKGDDGKFTVSTREEIAGKMPDKSTWFVYSESYILKTLIPNWKKIRNGLLETVKTIPNDAPDDGQVHYYTLLEPTDPNFGKEKTYERRLHGTSSNKIALDSISALNAYVSSWEYYLGQNEYAKLQAKKSKKIINRSISGGTSFTYTHTYDSTYTYTPSDNWKVGVIFSLKKNWLVNGNGTILTFADSEQGYKGSWKEDRKTTIKRQVGYTLSDPNKFAALSINVCDDPTGLGGPIFLTQGGQTMCPYEPGTVVQYYQDGLGKELDAATIRIEKCDLQVENPTITDVLSGETAYFKLKLQNQSETQTTSAYTVQLDALSNLQGASLEIDGQRVTDGLASFVLPYGTTEKTLALTQLDRSVTKYEFNLRLVSTNDAINTYGDWKTLTATFVPSSAKVDLATDHTIINKSMSEGLKVSLRNLNRQFEGLKGVRLLYRRQGTNNWIQEREWVMEAYKKDYPGDLVIPETGDIVHNMKFTTDGTYELRAQTFSLYGSTDVTRDTEIKTIIQDTQGPKMLGPVSPSDGQITIGNVNDMHILFNQDINTAAISREENINISGYQNNVSTEAEAAGVPSVALQLLGTEVGTQTGYDIGNSDIALDFFYYRQSDGNIVSVGTKQNRIALGTKEGGMLYATVGDTTYLSENVIAAGKWYHIAMNYRRTDVPAPQLTIGIASNDADEQQMVFLEKPVKAVSVKGNLTLGSKATEGRVCKLSLWNANRAVAEAYAEKYLLKAAYMPNIVGYWLMDEGHGTTLTDRARSRTITVNQNSWYLANKNMAAHLDGTKPMQLNFASASLNADDNFVAEMWFRAEANKEENQSATLFSTTNNVSVGFQNGNLVLTKYKNSDVPNAVVDTTLLVSSANLIDNNWHHLAVSVQRGTSAVAYLDGQTVRNFTDNAVPALSGAYIYVGGQEGKDEGTFTGLFTGDIDEIRLGTLSRSAKAIAEERYLHYEIGADSLVEGVSLYYPMETTRPNASGVVETVFDPTNKIKMRTQLPENNAHVTEASVAPPLKTFSSLLRLDDADYDFVADERNIYFRFSPRVYAKMHGNTYTFLLKGIKDEYGNSCDPINWKADFDLKTLTWSEKNLRVEKNIHENWSKRLYLVKNQPVDISYEVKGAPSWMTIDKPKGFIPGMSLATDIIISIGNTAPLGEHVVQLYVTDENGIISTLVIHVNVTADSPDWICDASEYSGSMTVTGQLRIGGKIVENTASKVAAFDAAGNCRGVASPQFMSTRNAYYINLMVYGEAEEKIYFKVYDADQAIAYSGVNILPDGVTTQLYLKFSSTANIGSYAVPAIFTTGRTIEQEIALEKGWNWASIYVNPYGRGALKTVLADYTETLTAVKSKTQLADLKTDSQGNKTWTGSLTQLSAGQMYSIHTLQPVTLKVSGELTDISTPVKISEGWNWIGSTSHYSIPTAEAFVSLNPQKGDLVKNRYAFAQYDGSRWNGTLTAIYPGRGYKYHAGAAGTIVFPNVANYSAKRRAATERTEDVVDEEIFADYADNMNIILRLTADNADVTDAHVAAYIDASLRGKAQAIDGLYYLTVAGNAADSGKSITLQVDQNGTQTTVVLPDVRYTTDLIKGSSDVPYTIDLNHVTAIASTEADKASDESPLYDLTGRRILQAATPGTYIKGNKKIFVK